MDGHKFSGINDRVSNKDIDNKIPIYKLKSKEKVLDYYENWTKKEQYNKDMVVWNYEAPQNTASLLNKHVIDKKIYLHPDFDTIDKHGGYEYRMHILNKIQGKNNTFYCGQDTVNEFWHELVLQSGLYVANMLGVPLPFKSEGYSLFFWGGEKHKEFFLSSSKILIGLKSLNL